MEKKQRLKYSLETLKEAIGAVQEGMPFKTASKKYNIPRATLQDKVKGRTQMEKKSGPETILTREEESLLVQWLFEISKCGFPATKNQMLDSVQLLLKELGRTNTFTDGRPGRKWYELFLKRHPELTKRIPQNLSGSRASLNENRIRYWFREVETYLKECNFFDITSNPNRIFNCDETAFFLCPKGDKVLVRKGEKTVYSFSSNDDKECLTTLITCNASGSILPPMVVFNYKRIPKSVTENFPQHWAIGKSDSGWMTAETFYEYIANIFHPWIIAENIPLPVILFLDGHTSHLSLTLSKFCSKANIILISLCPNATHILQPLDVAVFRPLKMEWKKSIHRWRLENNGKKITKDVFATILQTTLNKMNNFPDIAKNGFKTCGLVPFCVENIKFSKYFKDKDHAGELQDTSEQQRKGEDNQKAQNTVLEIVEQQIPPETLISFKQSAEIWEGAVEHASLFMVWRKLIALTESDDIRENNSIENVSTFDDLIHTLNYQEENNDEIDVTEIINIDNLNLPIVLNVTTDRQNASPLPSTSDIPNPPIETETIVENGDNEHNQTYGPSTLDIPNMPIEIIVENGDNERNQTHEPSTSNIPNSHIENIVKNGDNVQNQIYGSICRYSTSHSTPVKFSTIPPTMTPEKDKAAEKILLNDESTNPAGGIKSSSIPTPFKKSLFWPQSKTENETRKPREKVPAVTTSLQWQQYFEKKEEKKKQEEELKQKRKLERERKSVGSKKKKIKNDVSVRSTSRKEVKRIKRNIFKKKLPSPHHQKLQIHGTVLYVIQIDKLRCVCAAVAIIITMRNVLDLPKTIKKISFVQLATVPNSNNCILLIFSNSMF